jgi:hypothetical protein
MISTQPSIHITRAFMAAEMGKRIFLLLSAAISCSLAVVAPATAHGIFQVTRTMTASDG